MNENCDGNVALDASRAGQARRGLGRPSTLEDLEARVWMAVDLCDNPGEVAQALHEFMPKCTFAVSDSVPTARIVNTDPVRIEFGQRFLDEELNDDRDFLFVLLHEIYHHVLGHLHHSKKDKVSRTYRNLANIAADMLVNRAVCNRYFPSGVPLLARMYPDDELPALLLRPPLKPLFPMLGREREEIHRKMLVALKKMKASHTLLGKVWSVYKAAWIYNAPYEVVLEQLMELFGKIDSMNFMPILLIGDHEGIECPGGLPGFGGPEDRTGGIGGDEQEEEVEPDPAQVDRTIASALRRALEVQSGRFSLDEPQRIPGVVCVPGRRDSAFLAGGLFPVLYQAGTPMFDPLRLAHVYLDVSGSLDSMQARLFGILNSLRDHVADPVHQFSTKVADVSLAEFARGVKRTDGGTRFDCILVDAMARRYKQIIVITDGYAEVSERVAAAFRTSRIALHLVLTEEFGPRSHKCPLEPLAVSTAEMP